MEKSPVQLAKEGMGANALWAFARALDLQDPAHVHEEGEAPADSHTAPTLEEPFCALLLGAADPLHIFKTMARAWRHGRRAPLRFYVAESQAPLVARQLLLLQVLADKALELGPEERAAVFLELYGNLFVRERTAELVDDVAGQLVRAVTGSTGGGFVGDHLRLDLLKHRERDDLERVALYWRARAARPFAAAEMFDHRLRTYYGARYDSRSNLADWDYYTRLLVRTAAVQPSEFQRWRLHSLAYETRGQPYSVPNRTMATVHELLSGGVATPKWGFFSDIISGPYSALGLDSEMKHLLAEQGGKRRYSAQNVSALNLVAMLCEFEHSRVFSDPGASGASSSGAVEGKGPVEESSLEASLEGASLEEAEETPSQRNCWTERYGVEVCLLPGTPETLLQPVAARFRKLHGSFDIVYLGADYAHAVGHAGALVKTGGRIVAETAQMVLGLDDASVAAYAREIYSRATKGANPLVLLDNLDSLESPDPSFQRLQHLVFGRAADVDSGDLSRRVVSLSAAVCGRPRPGAESSLPPAQAASAA